MFGRGCHLGIFKSPAGCPRTVGGAIDCHKGHPGHGVHCGIKIGWLRNASVRVGHEPVKVLIDDYVRDAHVTDTVVSAALWDTRGPPVSH